MDSPSDTLKFVFLAPRYNPASNGIMLIYELAQLLRIKGHETWLCSANPNDCIWLESAPEDQRPYMLRSHTHAPANAIAILSDTTDAKMVDQLPCQRRVWYLMNRPWVLTGFPAQYCPEDAVIAYSGLISTTHATVFFNRKFTDFDPLSPDHREVIKHKKSLVLVYIGKSRMTGLTSRIRRIIMEKGATIIGIHRYYPASRAQLYTLLRQARMLISFDPLTNLNYEATLCGTPCYIADNYMGLDFTAYNLPLHGLFENIEELSSYYDNGIPADKMDMIWSAYGRSISQHEENALVFVEHIRAWFSICEIAKNNPAVKSLLSTHNRLRLEADHSYYKSIGGAPINAKLQNVSPSIGLNDWLFHTFERYCWYFYRDYHLYWRQVPPEKLQPLLENYRLKKAARMQRRMERRLSNISEK